jgi:Rrf2 family transcriptional regulator, cysteine metabolism repressor
MRLSTRSIYGLRFMFALARNYKTGPIQLSYISDKYEISEKYLSQIVIQLRHSKLINSTRGSNGGYYLAKEPDLIFIKDIVECLEGSLELVNLSEDNEKIPAIKDIWQELNDSIKVALNKYTLLDIVNNDINRTREFNYQI